MRLAAGGAAVVPVPAVDLPVVLALQAKMLHAVASVYQQPMDARRMAEVASTLGVGFLTRLGIRELLKLVPVPGLGSSVSALYAAASTYALGMALGEYFRRVRAGDMPDLKIIRKVYAEEFQRGRVWITERMRHRALGQGIEPVKQKNLKIRGIAALGLLSLPYLLLFAAGSVWLYQYHMLVWWGGRAWR